MHYNEQVQAQLKKRFSSGTKPTKAHLAQESVFLSFFKQVVHEEINWKTWKKTTTQQ